MPETGGNFESVGRNGLQDRHKPEKFRDILLEGSGMLWLWLFLGIGTAILALLDACKILDLMRWWFLGPLLLAGPHSLGWLRALFFLDIPEPLRLGGIFLTAGGLCLAYARLMLFPARRCDCPQLRVRILRQGQIILRAGMWALILQLTLYLPFVLLPLLEAGEEWAGWLLADTLLSAGIAGSIILAGAIRILCTCRRLGLVRRLLIVLNLWIPLVNLFLMWLLYRAAGDEYDHQCCKVAAEAQRAETQVCATRYPLVLVHGVGFRDLRYFNYWGRIPRALQRNGARIYYGHQEAWGTIEDNARAIRAAILEILEKENCQKVNIIAHSKGGLDARYLITAMQMGDRVASLTTVSTPHQGSQLLEVIDRLPPGIYRRITGFIDRVFRRVGDQNPDSGAAARQLSPAYAAVFNQDVPDDPGVYYQSYTSVMKNMFSNWILSIPYAILRHASGGQPNDGLVCVESARWGTFRGVFSNKRCRGISHGDMIDLQREDYKGFDVVEAYIRMVEDLKQKGF